MEEQELREALERAGEIMDRLQKRIAISEAEGIIKQHTNPKEGNE